MTGSYLNALVRERRMQPTPTDDWLPMRIEMVRSADAEIRRLRAMVLRAHATWLMANSDYWPAFRRDMNPDAASSIRSGLSLGLWDDACVRGARLLRTWASAIEAGRL